MLKKRVKYTDYDGVEREEDFYFNLSKAEVTEMELSETGGLSAILKRIVDEKDSKRIMFMFKDIVLKSFGVKSDDGKRFIKNQELKDGFAQTEAYVEIFMELASNAEAAAAFVNGIMPNIDSIKK